MGSSQQIFDMKLLQVGCFAATVVRAQDYESSGGDYELDGSRGDYEYEYDEFGNKKKKNKKNKTSYTPPVYSPPSYSSYNYEQDYGYAKAYAAETYAYALNCWPANFDTDKLVHHSANTDPYEVFNTGPLHYYGSEQKNAGDTDEASPSANANNRGGLYHYGWENDESTVGDTSAGRYKVNALPSQWIHYHSARHAGCLYELAGFDYKAATYNKVFDARYFNGYFDSNFAQADWANTGIINANADNSVYVPNWVHFFNAHLLVGGSVSQSTAPVATTGYTAAASGTINAKVVIANPQYEGLGFLNFIATYKVKDKTTGLHYTEFIDMTKKTNAGGDYDTYNAINTATTQHTAGVSGEWFYDGWMGTWTFNKDDSSDWRSVYSETSASAGAWTEFIAISSFPHNELGKDFRFNLRIITKPDTTLQIPESYYWYKVNSITITFPSAVAYALHNDYKRTVQGSAAFQVNSDDYQMMNVANADKRVNIIPPLDIGTWDDVSFLREEDWVRDPNATNNNKYNRINGWLDTQATGSTATVANWCRDDGDAADEDFCATKFKIEGLMNTYDEHFAAQKGNIQEIWIQLSYAHRINTVGDTAAEEAYNVESPFPYLHFHATEIASITADCDLTNVHNGNDCGKYTVGAHHKGDGPYGG